MKKILLIGAQHDDETVGEKLYRRICSVKPDLLANIDYIVGNPEAVKFNKRYIESDLNRSYNPASQTTYEERRAKEILSYIKEGDYELVLDLHTTTCLDQPPCFIMNQQPEAVRRFIRASNISKLVHLTHDIMATSLLGFVPYGIAIEVPEETIDDKLLDDLIFTIEQYLAGNASQTEVELYETNELLLVKDVHESHIAHIKNFVYNDHYQCYPILCGVNSYRHTTHYIGFKADTMRVIEL